MTIGCGQRKDAPVVTARLRGLALFCSALELIKLKSFYIRRVDTSDGLPIAQTERYSRKIKIRTGL